MTKPEEALAPLLAALRDLVLWFENADIRGAVIGGVAASLLGRPRVTRDVGVGCRVLTDTNEVRIEF